MIKEEKKWVRTTNQIIYSRGKKKCNTKSRWGECLFFLRVVVSERREGRGPDVEHEPHALEVLILALSFLVAAVRVLVFCWLTLPQCAV